MTQQPYLTQVRSSQRPNVILIFMDDQAHRTIGSLNNSEIQTPNLDELVARGTTFTHAFNQGSWRPAVCIPARAMLVIGTTLFNARRAVDSARLLGETFSEAGYRTFFTGKWHNSEESLNRSYDTLGPWMSGLHEDGFDPADQAYVRPSPGNTWKPDDQTLGRHWMSTPDGVVHSSERWASAAIDYLHHACQDDDPFFLHLAFHAPHDPRQSPREFLQRYRREDVEVPPNFMPQHPFDQGDSQIRDELLAPFPRTEDSVQLHRHEYYSILSHVDDQIGRVLAAVAEAGLADDTIVVFSGDHGLAVGEHGLMGKQNMYDHSVRVPLIFAGPGIPAGATLDALVYQASIYPTLCELLSLPAPAHIELPSLAQLITEGAGSVHPSVFSAYRDFQRMVRTDTHKLIAYPLARRHQLFDIVADPWEIRDLSEDPDLRPLLVRLRAELAEWQRRLGDDLDIAPAFTGDSSI